MKVLLEDGQGGSTYESYVQSYRKQADLQEKATGLKAGITVLEQLVTLTTITIPAGPTQATYLQQLAEAIHEQNQSLTNMVSGDYFLFFTTQEFLHTGK